MGTRRRLRVVLDAERRDIKAFKALDDIVVSTYMAHARCPEGRLENPIPRSIHGESMIVRRDLNLAGWLIPRCPYLSL